MRIYPAPHYAMGGLWVDYNLMSNIPGLFVLGEANFSVHGANRLGASALMQGLADGYFVIPYTIGGYLVTVKPGSVKIDHPEFKKSLEEVSARFDRGRIYRHRPRGRSAAAGPGTALEQRFLDFTYQPLRADDGQCDRDFCPGARHYRPEAGRTRGVQQREPVPAPCPVDAQSRLDGAAGRQPRLVQRPGLHL